MSKYKRIYYAQAVYHVIFRGNNRQFILKDVEEKKTLLSIVERYRQRYNFVVYAFVLMDNHVHMVVETSETHNISRVMQSILLAYSCWYRRTQDYVGHVWQGRFKSFCIQKERYILECISYIHENPVRAKIVGKVSDYGWSSARSYARTPNEEVDKLLRVERYAKV